MAYRNITSPGFFAKTRLSKTVFLFMVCATISAYPSSRCCTTYAICTATSSVVIGSEARDTSVFGVFTTRPSSSSLGENLRAGSSLVLIVRIASSRCSGQFRGMLSVFVSLYSSSPKSGAHSHLRTFNRILFVPSTKPLIQGEYAGTT